MTAGIADSNPPKGTVDHDESTGSIPLQVVDTLTDAQCRQLHALYQQEWWTRGRTLADTRKCVEGSQIIIGLVDAGGSLQGFARVLTDYVFKALVFDVIVAGDRRGTGIGKALVSLVLNHRELRSVKKFELYCLPEVAGFYERLGFSGDVDRVQLMRLDNR